MYLSGKKTYLAAALSILAAIAAFLVGSVPFSGAVQTIGLALGVGAIRFNVQDLEDIGRLIKVDKLRSSRIVALSMPFLSAIATSIAAWLAYETGEQSLFATSQIIIGAWGVAFLGRGVVKAESAVAIGPPG